MVVLEEEVLLGEKMLQDKIWKFKVQKNKHSSNTLN